RRPAPPRFQGGQPRGRRGAADVGLRLAERRRGPRARYLRWLRGRPHAGPVARALDPARPAGRRLKPAIPDRRSGAWENAGIAAWKGLGGGAADLLGVPAAMWIVAGLTAFSGLVVAAR